MISKRRGFINEIVTFDLLDVRHVIVDRGWRNDVRHVCANIHLDDLPDWWRWRWMIRWWKPISTV